MGKNFRWKTSVQTETYKISEISVKLNFSKARFCPFRKCNSHNNFFPFIKPNQKYSHANVFDSCGNLNFMLTFFFFFGLYSTFYLLHFNFTFELFAHLHLYHISLNNVQGSYFKINLE